MPDPALTSAASASSFYAFLAVCSLLAITPGPNMVYIMSRSIAQGRTAGLTSLAGVMVGYLFYMFAAAFGITALFVKMPFAMLGLSIAGAAYIAYLAWQALKPGGRSPFEVRALTYEPPRRLFMMGATTSLLNPKLAMIFLTLVPQFARDQGGSILETSMRLGSIMILAFALVNGTVAIGAGSTAKFLATRPHLMTLQRWFMGSVLLALAARMVVEAFA
ncbi:LysE family translocator [Pandoraea sp. ISTKB]|uniref:LysE family translocator n=1 Tax=Pandoraea sp. ISTKB TaxID=1586708 RepID=UPI00084688A3|nr:LysE family translocator [Pandoraea sp. ISTKB]ODP34181.1 lysine transporter LysE [Pandoraea sp. ISTKB]